MASPPADRRDQPARAAAIAAAERRLRRGFGAVRRLATIAPSDNVDGSADDPTLAQALALARLDAHRLAQRFDLGELLTPAEFERLDRILGIDPRLQAGASLRRLTV